jgi:hypothetical protein
MCSNPSASAISAAKYSVTMIMVVSKELVYIPEKKPPTSCTDNWDLLPLLFAFITTKLVCADFAAHKTAIPIFINLPDKMFGRQPFFLQYLKNPLSGDTDNPGYFRHSHEHVVETQLAYTFASIYASRSIELVNFITKKRLVHLFTPFTIK